MTFNIDISILEPAFKILSKFDNLLIELADTKLQKDEFCQTFNKIIKDNEQINIKNLKILFEDNTLNIPSNKEPRLFIFDLINKLINKMNETLVKYHLTIDYKDYNKEYSPKNEEEDIYKSYLETFLPESKALYNFSIIKKIYCNGFCEKKQLKLDKYKYEKSIYLDIDLKDNNNYIDFSKILDEYFTKKFKSDKQICECKNEDIEYKIITTIVKLPEILIFKIHDRNFKEIISPDGIINMEKYIDISLKNKNINTDYKLIATLPKSYSNSNFIGLYYRRIKSSNKNKINLNYKEEDEKVIENTSEVYENINICGIKNIGNNCYLNSGLQIIARCESLVNELKKITNNNFISSLYSVIKIILNEKIYDPTNFIHDFCSNNENYIEGEQCCSQSFIRTLINNINHEIINSNNKSSKDIVNRNELEYDPQDKEEKYIFIKYINDFYPESKAKSIFSGITISITQGNCSESSCINKKEEIIDFSFNTFTDQNIYLDQFYNKSKEINFSRILEEDIGKKKCMQMKCPNCKKNLVLKEITKYVKIPEILIFTLERFFGKHNKVKINPDTILDISKYIDVTIKDKNKQYLYELFAINVRFGDTTNYGHEICVIKINNDWYEINDDVFKKIDNLNKYNQYSYGLFYKKIN